MRRLLLLFFVMLGVSYGYSQTYTFTPAGAVGNTGPTQSDVNTAYAGTPLAGNVTVNGGIQYWVVPSTGTYRVTALGGQGYGSFGGRGASITGEVILTGGDTIKILVGQAAPIYSSPSYDHQFGGGGGSFVTLLDNTPLIIAGGGGGNHGTAYSSSNDAQITTSGAAGSVGSGLGTAGTNGMGGGTASSADGGGGLLGNGGGIAGGQAFVNGGLGGQDEGTGGFGGGGGTSSWNNYRAGGGGGYSGGGAATNGGTCCPVAGGGGSYNAGANPVNIAGVQTGNGQVIIEVLSSGASNDIGAISIDAPSNFCPGSQSVMATIQNFGINQITSATVNWSVNGATQTSYSFTGTLDTIGGTGTPTASINLGNYTFNAGTSYNVIVWTSLPNGVTDTVSMNDSVSDILNSGLLAPTNFSVYNVFTTTADFSWTPNPNAVNFNIIYGPAGFNPASTGTMHTATSSPTTISGLSSNTAYEAYIYADCGTGQAGVDTSGPISFRTTCVIATAPFTENFDGSNWTASGSNTGNAIDQCWTANPDMSQGSEPFKWIPRSTGPTSGNGPTMDATGGNFMYVEASSSSAGDIAYLTTPPIDVSNLTTPGLYFMEHRYSGGTIADMDVEVSSDGGATWATEYSITGDVQTSASAPWELRFVNLGTYTGDTIMVRFKQTGNGCCGDAAIDSVVVDEAPICPWPTAINVSGITNTSAEVNWNDPSGSSWTIEWGPCGFSQGTGGSQTTSSNPYTITGLAGNTCYDVYVRADCSAGGNGNSIWMGPISFTTRCNPISAPYFKDFENDNLDVPPICWEDYETYSASFVEVENFTGTSAPFAGSQALYLYNSGAASTDTLWAISPQFSDLPIGDKRVRFFANSDDPVSQLIVGTVNSLMPGATFNPVDTITFPTADTYQQVLVNFTTANGYNGTDQYIVLSHNMGGTFDYIRIDEFHYEVIPACVAPSSLSLGAFGVTANNASVYWGSGTQGSKTYVEVGFPGFTPGSGNFTVLDSVAGSMDTLMLSGLSAQTSYEFYVQDSCTSGGLSPWIGPFSFTTACNPFTLPYLENFGGGAFPTCWSRSNTSDVTYETTCGSQSGVIQIEYEEEIVTPDIDVSNATSLKVSYLIGAGACDNDPENNEHFYVEYWDGTQWILAMDHDGSLPNSFVAQSFIVPGGSFSNLFKVRFNMIDGTTDSWQVDDVLIEQGPACFVPLNLTANSITDTTADLIWSGTSSAISYEVWFGPKGFFQGTQTTTGGVRFFTSTDSMYVDTLTSLSCYEYLVRAICGPNDTTLWSAPVSFCTQCPGLTPMNLPYFDGFESFNTTVTQTGTFFCGPSYSYSMEDPGGSGEVLFNYTASSGPTPPYNGSRSAGLASNSSSDPVFLIFTGDMTNYTAPGWQVLLSFYFADHADETGADDKVWTRGQQGDPWIEILDWNSANATSNWQKFEIRLDSVLAAHNQSFSSSTQIRWGQMDNASHTGGDGFSIDDLRIEASQCAAPSNLMVSNTTSTTVDLSWTTGGAPGVAIEYGTPGFVQGTGQQVYVTGGSPYTLTGLTPGTPYEFYLRDSCGVNNLSFSLGPVSDTTLCTTVLSGTYTIGGATADYQSFAAAANDLNICGISAPVIFNVNAGTYTDNFQIYNVPGASSLNTITINGNAAGSKLIWDGSGVQAAMLISNTPYVTVNNMTVVNNAASEGFGILLTNDADNFTLNNSMVVVDSSGVFGSDLVAFLVSGSLENDNTFGADVDSLSITNSDIVGGYYGMQYYGNSSSSTSNGFTMTNSSVRHFYLTGVYLYSIDGVEVHDNEIVSTVSVTNEDGFYGIDIYDFNIHGNYVHVKDYGIYINDGNDGFTPTTNSTLINNMVISETDYGIYLNDVEYTSAYHNSVLGYPGFVLNDEANIDVRNNVFISSGDYPFESIDILDATTSINYNLYYEMTGGSLVEIGSSVYADLAAWVTADPSLNANSVEGDPVIVSPTDLHLIGGLANEAGDNSVGISIDIDGDVRPSPGTTTVDIGADEYTPPAGDLALISADFIKGYCLSNMDSIEFMVQNLVSAIDFSVDPLTATYQVSGPVNSTGTVTLNTGNLAVLDTVIFYGTNVDLSLPGTYTLTAYIDSNAVNLFSNNDTILNITIDVKPEFRANPSVITLPSINDSAEICIESSFFGAGAFFFTEISHYSGFGTGAGTLPSYVPDDYIEITGVPGSDLDGVTFEQWNSSSMVSTHTFGPGTVIGPNGTAIIMIGSGAGADQPANFMYNGLGGTSTSWSSSTDAGTILKDAAGNIMDAVGYDNTYTFPAASGATPADWSGQTGATSGTAGIRLTGPDNNMASDWTVVSSSVTQDAQVLNAGVSLPVAGGTGNLTWTLNGNVIDTMACIMAGPYTAPGVYNYIATFSNACGSFTDTVTVIIPSCSAPSALTGAALSTTSASLSWDSTGTGASTFDIEYGPIGFTVGSGTRVNTSSNTFTVNNLTPNLCQEYYVRSNCSATDSSIWVGPITICPEEIACDNIDVYAAGMPISTQSSLFIDWQGAGGDEEVSTAQANSSPNSLHVYDSGPAGFVDVVAYFDTISSGAWNIAFDMYMPSGKAGYFNIQQNHSLTGTGNLWGGEIYFQANGTAEVQYSTGSVVAGTFTYPQGQWISMNTVIDLTNDTVWFEMNGTSTGIGYDYSLANAGSPLQFNGINFYSGAKSGSGDAVDYYMDNFCVTPYLPTGGCADPTALTVSNIGCDEADLSWTSSAATDSSIVMYGANGFTPGTGGTSVTVNTNILALTGLNPGTAYDFYVMDICSNGDSSAMVGPVSFNTLSGPITADFTSTPGTPTLVNMIVSFDASASVGAVSYDWDFGDGGVATTTTPNTTHSYAMNNNYQVCLTVTGPCGSDTYCDTIMVQGISLKENYLARSLSVYPNPTSNLLNISFDAQGSMEASLRLRDLSGKLIMEVNEKVSGSEFKHTLDISNLAKGVYMLEVVNGDSKAVRRITKH